MNSLFSGMQDWVVQKGIASEIRQAGLVEETLKLPFGEVRYLHRKQSGTPSGEAVLMLHGAVADKPTWVRFCKYLKTGLPLLVPDLPGHGNSMADLEVDYGIGAQAQRIAAMLRALNVARVHVVASSMGGAIALRLAFGNADLVASLVLIDAVGVQGESSWLQEHIGRTGKNPMIEVRSKRDYLNMIRIGMKKPPYMPGFVLSSLARSYIARLRINEKIGHDIAADLDQSGTLGGIACPVLIIWGRDDQVVHVSTARLLHQQLAGSRLEIFDGVGHVPMVEAPQQVAALCTDFLATASSRRHAPA